MHKESVAGRDESVLSVSHPPRPPHTHTHTHTHTQTGVSLLFFSSGALLCRLMRRGVCVCVCYSQWTRGAPACFCSPVASSSRPSPFLKEAAVTVQHVCILSQRIQVNSAAGLLSLASFP